MRRCLTFGLACVFGVSFWGCGKKKTDATATDAYVDATVAAAENYKLLSQEGPVRLVEMKLGAGTSDNMHSHKSETVYFLTGGKCKIHAGEEVMDADIPDGHVMFHEPWTHRVENVGETNIHAIIFEQMEPVKMPAMEKYIDATVAAKDYYKLLGTEGGVRVVEMMLPAGKKDEEHSHSSESVYFITGGKVKIHADGEVMDADISDGHIMHHDAWTHSIENVGTTDIHAIIFERMPL